MERLRNSRAKLLDRHRQAGERVRGQAVGTLLVQEVMEQEMQTLQAAQGSLPSLRGKEALAQVSTYSARGPTRSPASLRQHTTRLTRACQVQLSAAVTLLSRRLELAKLGAPGSPAPAASAGCCAVEVLAFGPTSGGTSSFPSQTACESWQRVASSSVVFLELVCR